MPSSKSILIAIVGLFCLLVLFLVLVSLGANDSRIKTRLKQEGAVVEGIVLDRKRAYVPRPPCVLPSPIGTVMGRQPMSTVFQTRVTCSPHSSRLLVSMRLIS